MSMLQELARAARGVMAPPTALRTFEQMNREIYAPDTWFGSWPQRVRATCEATGFEQHCLWEQWAVDSRRSYYRDKVRWTQHNHGTYVILPNGRFETGVSLNVEEIEGHFVLFWYCHTAMRDQALVESWVERSFPMASDRHGHRLTATPMNFHAIIHGLNTLNGLS